MDLGRAARACALLVACSSGKPRAIEDAKRPAAPEGAASDGAALDGVAGKQPPASSSTGDVSVRVEWTKVPAAVRASPGTTPCATPRQPQVAPSTTWGIGDVLVIVDGAPVTAAEAHVRLADCALSPRISIGSSLVIDSAAERPAKLAIDQRRRVADLDTKLSATTTRVVMLPVAGHAVTVALESGAVYELATDAKDPETAWIVVGSGAVTDLGGVVVVKDVSVGVHAVRAWLPPRGGQPSRRATGQVTVMAGELAELTLQLEP